MKVRLLFLAVLASVVALVASQLPSRRPAPTDDTTPPTDALQSMREAALALLESVDEAQRQTMCRTMEDEERQNWYYVPHDREGLMLKNMTLDQRRRAFALMRSALSSQGYLKATSIMHLETVLAEMEQNPVRRDPEKYYFTLFGDPAQPDEPWGWRVEGHHLSLNFSSANGALAITPAFYGSNPGEVRSGPYAGFRILADEEDLGLQLLGMLNADQRRRAVIAAESPYEIVSGNQRRAELEKFEGIRATDLTEAQRLVLWMIVEEAAHNLQHDFAHTELEKIKAAGLDSLYFAWAGGDRSGTGTYYRIHGPTVLFEFDNTQNDANHIHTVWRDLQNDFGEDLLRRHYETHPHSHVQVQH
ncbi:Protein of unknown function [Catalinimonas alkaloidigena]|uniref:DUF3500 domain-containing protein n=1 Tax=Catalinimonas alkaloidigena TaxID=1075417 RepID=A0A1G9A8Y9_9BACT|nr:DUF3500 domain-containing protein [Catalinimonas alkaloidigena]SDK23767.1 Protein of unknown function [Catalinimonas alkaloidigena]